MFSKFLLLARCTTASLAHELRLSRIQSRRISHAAFSTTTQSEPYFSDSGPTPSADIHKATHGDASAYPYRTFSGYPGSPEKPPRKSHNQIYLGGLTDESRKDVMNLLETVKGVAAIRQGTQPDGSENNYCHVIFKHAALAKPGIQALKRGMTNHPHVRITFAGDPPPVKIIVRDVKPAMREDLLAYTQTLKGFLEAFEVPADRLGINFFLDFSNAGDVITAIQQLNERFSTQHIRAAFLPKTGLPFLTEHQPQTASAQKTIATPENSRLSGGRSRYLFVGNLPFDISKAEVAEAFKDAPGYEDVTLAVDVLGRGRGHAMIIFESIEYAQNTLDTIVEGDLTILGRRLRAEFSKKPGTEPGPTSSKILFLGGLPKNATEVEIRDAFKPHNPEQVKIMNIDPVKPSWAHVAFETESQATLAAESCHLKPIWPGGPPMRLDFHRSKRSDVPESPTEPTRTLFVGGIGKRTPRELVEIFRSHPPISARVVTDNHTLHSRGFGFVDYTTIEDATTAKAAFHALEISDGQYLRVTYASEIPVLRKERTVNTPEKKREYAKRRAGKLEEKEYKKAEEKAFRKARRPPSVYDDGEPAGPIVL